MPFESPDFGLGVTSAALDQALDDGEPSVDDFGLNLVAVLKLALHFATSWRQIATWQTLTLKLVLSLWCRIECLNVLAVFFASL